MLFVSDFMVIVFQSYREFTEVWCRPLYDASVAVVLFSRRADQPYPIVASFEEVLLLHGIDLYVRILKEVRFSQSYEFSLSDLALHELS